MCHEIKRNTALSGIRLSIYIRPLNSHELEKQVPEGDFPACFLSCHNFTPHGLYLPAQVPDSVNGDFSLHPANKTPDKRKQLRRYFPVEKMRCLAYFFFGSSIGAFVFPRRRRDG